MTDDLRERLKAFIVQEPDEFIGDVWFARSDIEARKDAAEELSAGEIAGLSCQRCPALDGCESDPRAVRRYLLAAGWWFETGHGDRVTIDDAPFVSRAGNIYKTWMEWLEDRRHEALLAKRRRDAERDLWGRFYFAERIHVHVEPQGQVVAMIALPYLRDGLRWVERDDRWTVTRRDLAQWRRAYEVNRDMEMSDDR